MPWWDALRSRLAGSCLPDYNDDPVDEQALEEEGVALTVVGPALVEPGQAFDVSTLVYNPAKDAEEADNFLFRNHTGPATLLEEENDEQQPGAEPLPGRDLTLMLRVRHLRPNDETDECQLKPCSDDR